jgi:hypothetical protein
MSSNETSSPLVRIGRRVAAMIADCNYAVERLSSLQHTPERY